MNRAAFGAGASLAVLGVWAAAPARAQDNASAQDTPVYTLPQLENFSIAPLGTPATPTPAPTPAPISSPAPTPTPTPVPIATPVGVPAAGAARPAPNVAPRLPAKRLAPAPAAAPAPTPSPTPLPAPVAAMPHVAPSIAPPAPVEPATGRGDWQLPLAIGTGAALLALAGGLVFRRRRRAGAARAAALETTAVPAPTPGPPPLRAKSEPIPAPAAPAVAPSGPPATGLYAEIAPSRAQLSAEQLVLELDLIVRNVGTQPADEVRLVLSMLASNPDQDRQIAGFGAQARMVPGLGPIRLGPGETRRLSGRLTLPLEGAHVIRFRERPMLVPLVLVHLRWRAGLTLRSQAGAQLVGTAGADGRLGPIWLDRGPFEITGLAARAHVPQVEPA